MKAIIKILRAILALILCAVLALNLWMLYQQKVQKKDAPEILGYSQYIVASGSMEPTLAVGDMILVKRQDRYVLGDVVTFRAGSSPVTHRIMGSVEGKFITQGDANNVEDQELLDPENILGKVELVLPGAGNSVQFMRSPLGLLVILAVGLVLFLLPDLAGTMKTKAKGKHEE